MFFLGYMLMAAAPNIWLLIPSTAVRSCGSSVVWVYSTLLIQLRVPNQLQGRIMALEMAFYVVRIILDHRPQCYADVSYHSVTLQQAGSRCRTCLPADDAKLQASRDAWCCEQVRETLAL